MGACRGNGWHKPSWIHRLLMVLRLQGWRRGGRPLRITNPDGGDPRLAEVQVICRSPRSTQVSWGQGLNAADFMFPALTAALWMDGHMTRCGMAPYKLAKLLSRALTGSWKTSTMLHSNAVRQPAWLRILHICGNMHVPGWE